MNTTFKFRRITEHVHWVGAIDWNIRDFHGYLTNRGTTYNAYLILADKITLIDTVKAPFKNELLARIASIIEPTKIDYIVSNHSEMDHSGSLPQIIEAVKPEKVFASKMGTKALKAHFGLDVAPVENGGTLDLGNMALTFVETKMLHWPDSMVSYLDADKVLFSQDGFGMHLATSERFSDEIDRAVMEQEAAKYFANILLPYSPLVEKLLADLPGLGLDIEILAPDHGPVWRGDNIGWILGLWGKWAKQSPTNKAVIVYDTMWGSTDLIARAIADGLIEGGTSVELMKLRASHRSDVVTELLDAGAIIAGSPTINNNIFPTVADLLYYIKGLKPKNLIGAAFGSYGWSGEAVGQIEEKLKEMNVELAHEGFKANYVPDAEALESCRKMGKAIAKKCEVLSRTVG